MPGREATGREISAREVHLTVNEKEVELNGFVKDMFQETVIGMVRALGTDDENGSIRLTIGASVEGASDR